MEEDRLVNQEKSVQIFVQNPKKSPSKYIELVKNKKLKKPLVGTFDTLLSLLLLGPCVIGFWRGTWLLQDMYKQYFPLWLSLFLGVSYYVIVVIVQNFFNNMAKKEMSATRKTIILIAIRVYTYIFAVTTVMMWRAEWAYIDLYFNIKFSPFGSILQSGSENMLAACGVTLLAIVGCRSLRNCLAPPFIFYTDRKRHTFIIPTRFRTKMSEKTSLYVLDCLFSVLVIGTLVVFVWRGAWALVDIYLFPENDAWSAWASLIIGYSAVAIAFILQPFMRWLCDRITGVSRLLVADLFLILSLIGTVNVWRGIWNLLNLYFLPEDLELSCWITHWVCLVVLVLLGCSNSLLVRGVYIDAEEPAGKCVVFPCYYLRLIFQEQKLKKLNKVELVNVNNHVQTFDNHKEGDV